MKNRNGIAIAPSRRPRGTASRVASVIGTGVVGAAVVFGVLWSSGNLATVGRAFGLIEGAAQPAAEPAAPSAPEMWACFWDPTINDDWHDDVLCTRGLESIRPTLLPEKDFVTEEEMMVAAAVYAATLNG